MKKWAIIAVLMAAVGVAVAGSLFTDVDSYTIPNMIGEINTAFDAIEDSIDGTTPMASPVVQGTLTAISTNSATTNVIVTVDGVVDGETIKDDSIDDDSIDFADVTGADLTLTDCGVITSSGKVTGTELALSATQWFDVINTTQLVFIAAGVTNVIDADITTP